MSVFEKSKLYPWINALDKSVIFPQESSIDRVIYTFVHNRVKTLLKEHKRLVQHWRDSHYPTMKTCPLLHIPQQVALLGSHKTDAVRELHLNQKGRDLQQHMARIHAFLLAHPFVAPSWRTTSIPILENKDPSSMFSTVVPMLSSKVGIDTLKRAFAQALDGYSGDLEVIGWFEFISKQETEIGRNKRSVYALVYSEALGTELERFSRRCVIK